MTATIVPETTDSTRSSPNLRERIDAHAVRTVEDLYAVNGEPREAIRTKHTSYLTPLLVEYLAQVPFFALATANADGSCDVTPRGDAPGAIQVLDERTVAIPERPGNRRIDSLRNIITNPHVGILFLIPAVDEAVRLNGRATITTDPELLSTMTMQGKTPKIAIVIDIDEVYVHCARAFLRSGLWEPKKWPDPDSVPSLAAILAEQKNLPAPDESCGKRNEEYRSVLY
jgi:uncharacterized protein